MHISKAYGDLYYITFVFWCVPSLHRAMISVSWVHQRRQMLTGCFVDNWEPFMYLVKPSTQLRSLPFTSLAPDTR